MIWALQLLLWCTIALSLPYTLEELGIEAAEHLPLLLCTDLLIRLVAQKTPDIPFGQYALLPVRRWQVVAVHLIRMTIVSTTWIWLPALWGQWWLMGGIVLNGYVYLVLWHGYKRLISRGSEAIPMASAPWRFRNCASHIVNCELKMRLRIPSLRVKMRNGLLASLMLLGVSLIIRNEAYTDFAVLYTLLFPTLPLLTSRLGYEQAYRGLLHTRMHSLMPLYWAKYLAAVLLLVPCTALLTILVAMGTLSPWRLVAWTLLAALAIYPLLLALAPRCKVDSPSSQMTSLLAMTLPVAAANVIEYII